jgi:hypothetical protein
LLIHRQIRGFCCGLAIALVSAASAVADPLPAAAPVAQAEYTLKVSRAELTQIGGALGALPFREVAALINKIQAQVAEQEKPPAPSPAAATPPADETKPQ